jgi:hypothetical protein
MKAPLVVCDAEYRRGDWLVQPGKPHRTASGRVTSPAPTSYRGMLPWVVKELRAEVDSGGVKNEYQRDQVLMLIDRFGGPRKCLWSPADIDNASDWLWNKDWRC